MQKCVLESVNMAKFSSPPAGPLAARLESDFCRCRLEVLHLFQNFTHGAKRGLRRPPGVARRRSLGGASTLHSPSTPHLCVTSKLSCDWAAGGPGVCTSPKMMREC